MAGQGVKSEETWEEKNRCGHVNADTPGNGNEKWKQASIRKGGSERRQGGPPNDLAMTWE